jgi:hypothetical protein
MYIRMRVLPWSNTFVSVGQVRINFSSLVNQEVLITKCSGKWKKEDITAGWSD